MALETLDSTRNSKTAGAQPAVRITGLRKSFDGRLVLGGIDAGAVPEFLLEAVQQKWCFARFR